MKTINHMMLVALLGISIMLCSCTESSQAMTKQNNDRLYSTLSLAENEEESIDSEGEVYICTGPSSKRYHKSPDCMGLSSCSADVRCVSVSYAEKLGRTPCKRCY